MSVRWTESLAAPLPRLAAGRDWARIQESPWGGWLLLANGKRDDQRWFHADSESAGPRPVGVFDDERLPTVRKVVGAWLARGRDVRLLAWRPGRRAVFRVRTTHGTRICKLYRKDRQCALRWAALADHGNHAWRAPRVLSWNAKTRCLILENCPGRSLNERWLAGEGQVRDGDRIAALLNWLVGLTPPSGFPTHDAEDEISILTKRLESYARTLKRPPIAAADLTRRVTSALRAEPVVTPILSHRDLHDKQVLIEGDAGYLIDLDLAAVAPPALDLGNILAHLRLRALQGAGVPWREIATRTVLLAGVRRGAGESLGTWTAAALLRLGLIYSRRSRKPGLLEQLLDSSEQALERGGEWAGLGF
jgi:hypothetical protein